MTVPIRISFQDCISQTFVAAQFLKPAEGSTSDSKAVGDQGTQSVLRRLAELGLPHVGGRLVGSELGHGSLLDEIFTVHCAAFDATQRFAVFAGEPSQQWLGLNPVADLITANPFGAYDRGDNEVIRTWDHPLWFWNADDDSVTPMERFGRVQAIDIAADGQWAAVIEDFPGNPAMIISRVELPSGRRTWSIPCESEAPHVRISQDGRYIATAGPRLIDTATQQIYTPPWLAHLGGADGFLGLPLWRNDPNQLLCVGINMARSDELLLFDVSIAESESAPNNIRAIADGTTSGIVSAADLDPSETYLLCVARVGGMEDLGADNGPPALSCINIADASILWTAAMKDDVYIRLHDSPRWTARRARPAADSTSTPNGWRKTAPTMTPAQVASSALDLRAIAFDSEYPHRCVQAINRIANERDLLVSSALATTALADFYTARVLGQADDVAPLVCDFLEQRSADGVDPKTSDFLRRLKVEIEFLTDNEPPDRYWSAPMSRVGPTVSVPQRETEKVSGTARVQGVVATTLDKSRDTVAKTQAKLTDASAAIDRSREKARRLIDKLEAALGRAELVPKWFRRIAIFAAVLCLIPLIVSLSAGAAIAILTLAATAVSVGLPLFVSRRFAGCVTLIPSAIDDLRRLVDKPGDVSNQLVQTITSAKDASGALGAVRALRAILDVKNVASSESPNLAALAARTTFASHVAMFTPVTSASAALFAWAVMLVGLIL